MSAGALSAVVLAAGEGTRMRSERPKPLHRLCGRPMVLHVLHALAELELERAVVVVGHGGAWVTKAVAEQPPPGLRLDFVEQRVQRGTGDAVLVALTAFPDDDVDDHDIVILPGDTPLLRPPTLAALVRAHRQADAAATLLTARLANPDGYGRVVRDKAGRVARIVEHVEATADERAVDEINTSIYVFRRSVLAPALRRLSPDNSPGRVLPDRHRRRPARRRLSGGVGGGRRPDGGRPGSTTATSWPSPRPSCGIGSTSDGCGAA